MKIIRGQCNGKLYFNHKQKLINTFFKLSGYLSKEAPKIVLSSFALYCYQKNDFLKKLYLQNQDEVWYCYGVYESGVLLIRKTTKNSDSEANIFITSLVWPYNTDSLTTLFSSFLHEYKIRNLIIQISKVWLIKLHGSNLEYEDFCKTHLYKKYSKKPIFKKILKEIELAWINLCQIYLLFQTFLSNQFNLDIFGHVYYLSEGFYKVMLRKLQHNPFSLYHHSSFLYKFNFYDCEKVFWKYSKVTYDDQIVFLSYALGSFLKQRSLKNLDTIHILNQTWSIFIRKDKYSMLLTFYEKVNLNLADPEILDTVLKYATVHKIIKWNYQLISDFILYEAAFHIHQFLKKRIQYINKTVHQIKLPNIPTSKFKINERQNQALLNIFNHSLSIITGPPGSGKSSIISKVVDVNNKFNYFDKIFLMALTGVAVRNLKSRVSNLDLNHNGASTIHSFLWNAKDPTERSNQRCLFVIDEASMVDTLLGGDLVNYINLDDHVVLVGDIDQLSPISPGSVFYDLSKHYQLPTAELNHIYRQEQGNDIVDLIHLIQDDCSLPALTSYNNISFQSSAMLSGLEVKEKIKSIIKQIINRGDSLINDIQVIVPFNNGDNGVNDLNQFLQRSFNPYASNNYSRMNKFFINDKVMVMINQKSLNLYNGDIGRIVSINGLYCKVKFDFLVQSVLISSKTIKLAYALTIHKVQGLQFKNIILIADRVSFFWSKNLIYTAITRASHHLYIIGLHNVLQKGLSLSNFINKKERKTWLKQWNPLAKV